jgi:AcrR family transcriptional regulator
MRADARRNYELLLAAAGAAFAEHGVEASLEDVARRAGVGIGTLYRHFPTRQALAQAVYRAQIEAICAQAEQLLTASSPGEALATWLQSLVDFGATKRGLAEFLKASMQDDGSSLTWSKDAMRSSGGALLARAQQAGVVRPDIEIGDLLRLAHAISWASESTPEGTAGANRCLSLLMDGLRRHEPTAT